MILRTICYLYQYEASDNQSMTTKKTPMEGRQRRKDAEADILFMSIGEGAIVTDRNGKISRINDAALKILEVSREAVLGKWYPGAVIAEDKDGNIIPNMNRPIMEVFLTGQPVSKRIYFKKGNDERVPVSVTVSPIMVQGQPAGAIEIFRDISEELELENAKDEFISIASHQLRTPATVVKQYLGMMLDGYMGKLTGKQMEMLRTAYEFNDNQLAVLNDLLRVAQADANRVKVIHERVDVIELVKEIVSGQKTEYEQSRLALQLVAQE